MSLFCWGFDEVETFVFSFLSSFLEEVCVPSGFTAVSLSLSVLLLSVFLSESAGFEA
ncbi:MAG: hypothetical protein IIX89_05145 [Oscillospiraceae bacterium]|nr:hypothetical protein [Oscillospiraceae bacterium]